MEDLRAGSGRTDVLVLPLSFGVGCGSRIFVKAVVGTLKLQKKLGCSDASQLPTKIAFPAWTPSAGRTCYLMKRITRASSVLSTEVVVFSCYGGMRKLRSL
jgi:hypothetical protein